MEAEVIGSNVETLRWKDGHLEMIDQRVLPARFEYISYDSATGVADGIHSMGTLKNPMLNTFHGDAHKSRFSNALIVPAR